MISLQASRRGALLPAPNASPPAVSAATLSAALALWVAALALPSAAQLAQSAPSNHSALFGEAGEAWDPGGRLPDFSRAGYRDGDAEPPFPEATASVRDFGALGDGETDDTAAFEAALAEVGREGGVLAVPAGTYVLRKPLEINRPGVVLRGEGPDRSRLFFPLSLTELDPREELVELGTAKNPYSFSGAFLTIRGEDRGRRLAALSQPAARGDTVLTLDRPRVALAAGDRVRLRTQWSDDLGRALLLDTENPGAGTAELNRSAEIIARVVAVGQSSRAEQIDEADPAEHPAFATVTLDRPLPIALERAWSPTLHSLAPTVVESGVEDLGFVFAGRPKRPHLQEEGFNAIVLFRVADCWARNVAFTDADNAVTVQQSTNVLLKDLRFALGQREGLTGHHAVWLTGGSQNTLVTDFVFETRFVHDLTVEGFSTGNVFRRGRGVSMSLDHHANLPFANLFTDLDLGDPRSVWRSGGRRDRLPNTALSSTLWNLRHTGAALPPIPGRWPGLNLVGLQGFDPTTPVPPTVWLETFDGPPAPPDLYEAQRHLRGFPPPAPAR